MLTSLAIKLGDHIDATWAWVGLDLSQYAKRQRAQAENIAVWCIAVGVTIAYACLYYIFAALLVDWERSYGWSKSQLTIAFTACIFVSAFISPYAGRVVDGGKARWLLSVGLLIGGLAVAALCLIQSQAMFIGIWLIIGIAHGCCLYDPCFALITRVLSDESSINAPKAITRITLTAGFASTIAFPSAAWLTSTFGWQGTALAFAAVIVFIGAPAMYAGGTLLECCPHDIEPETRRARDKAALRATRKRLAYWILFAAFPLMSLTTGMILTHIMPILLEKGITQAHAVYFVALIGPMQVLGRFFVRRVAERIGTLATTLMAFTGISVSVFILLIAGANHAVMALFACLFGAAYGLVSILKPILTAETLGKNAFGAVSGSLALPFLVCFALSPVLGAELWAINERYTLALTVAGLVATTALLCIAFLGILGRKSPSEQTK